MSCEGNTYMIGGLETALYLVKMGQEENEDKNEEEKHPIIIFLTDGEPTVGIRSTDEIEEIVSHSNLICNKQYYFILFCKQYFT